MQRVRSFLWSMKPREMSGTQLALMDVSLTEKRMAMQAGSRRWHVGIANEVRRRFC